MRHPLRRAANILGCDSADEQSVGDQGAMTAPRNRFGTHEGQPGVLCEFDQMVDGTLEFCGSHVVGVATKRGISPAGVDGVRARFPKTAQRGAM